MGRFYLLITFRGNEWWGRRVTADYRGKVKWIGWGGWVWQPGWKRNL
jgi:hypothetical protein